MQLEVQNVSDGATNGVYDQADGGAPALESELDSAPRVAKFWRDYMSVFDELNKCGPYCETVERHISLLRPRAGELVFDAGTGTGNHAQALVQAGARVKGLDFCETGLAQARSKLPAVELELGDLRQRLPYPDAHFDKVGSCLVLHLLDRKSQEFALRECARVLKPGGTIAISGFATTFRPLGPVYGYAATLGHWLKTRNPIGGTLFALANLKQTLSISYFIWQIMGREKRGVYNFFCARGLQELFAQAGLEMVHYEPVFARQCAIALARKPCTESL